MHSAQLYTSSRDGAVHKEAQFNCLSQGLDAAGVRGPGSFHCCRNWCAYLPHSRIPSLQAPLTQNTNLPQPTYNKDDTFGLCLCYSALVLKFFKTQYEKSDAFYRSTSGTANNLQNRDPAMVRSERGGPGATQC